MSPKEFINSAAGACLSEQLATIMHDDLRQHWGQIIRKYLWAVHDQKWQTDPCAAADAYEVKKPT